MYIIQLDKKLYYTASCISSTTNKKKFATMFSDVKKANSYLMSLPNKKQYPKAKIVNLKRK